MARGPAALAAALAALALLAPAAEACSVQHYSGHPFVPLAWTGDDVLLVEWGGRNWTELNVTTGRQAPVPAREAFDPAPLLPPEEPKGIARGDLALEPVRGEGTGMTMAGSCGGAYPVPPPVIGLRLVRPSSGEELRRWSADGTGPWSGALWSNGTHAFVWDHVREELARIRWSDGSHATTALDLPDQETFTRPYPESERTFVGDALVLKAATAVAVIEPAGPSLRVIRSPVAGPGSPAGSSVHILGEAAYFLHHGERWSVGRVGLPDGRVAWTVQTEAGHALWTERTVVAVDGDQQRLRRFLDGAELQSIPFDDGRWPVVSQKGNLVAVGFPEPRPRLVVYGPAMEVLYEGRGQPWSTAETSTSTETGGTASAAVGTTSAAGPDGTEGPAAKGAPSVPFAWAAAALAAAAAGLRRRLP